MKIVFWNVNGIAACVRKGLAKFLADVPPDILCCQDRHLFARTDEKRPDC